MLEIVDITFLHILIFRALDIADVILDKYIYVLYNKINEFIYLYVQRFFCPWVYILQKGDAKM